MRNVTARQKCGMVLTEHRVKGVRNVTKTCTENVIYKIP